MNIFRKIYCRAFQTVFKIALPFLPYRSPKILGSTDEIPELLKKKKCGSVMLVTDRGIRELGLTQNLEKALSDSGISCTVYDGTAANPTTRKDAEMAVKLIFENLEKTYKDGKNIKARRNMLRAAYYAGCAFTKSYVGYVHAVAHSLGGEYNVAHGLANAVLLPNVLEAYGDRIYKKLARLAVCAKIVDEGTDTEEAARAFITAIREMRSRFGIGDTIPELREEDIPKLARYADKEANPLYPVPVLMDAEELETFYYQILEND